MKKSRLLYYILTLLLALALVLVFSQRNSTWSKVQTDFAIDDTASVYRIFLADKTGKQCDLLRKPNGEWELNGKFTARQDAIDILLATMTKITVRQSVPKSAHNNVVSRMSAIATKVEIYQNKGLFSLGKKEFFIRQRLSKVYYVGDATMDNRGTYMLMDKSSQPFIMHIQGFRGFVHTRYSTKENDWRNHEIFKYRLPEIKSISVQFTANPSESFHIDYSGGDNFSMRSFVEEDLRIMELDTIKVLDFLVSFTDVRFEDFLYDFSQSSIDSIVATNPLHIITVVDAMGRTQRISTYRRITPSTTTMIDGAVELIDLDRLYIYLHDSKELVLGQYFALDRLLQPLSFYLRK